MIEYFDTHCHLTDAAFREDREAVLHRARAVGVARLVSIASNLDDARDALEWIGGREGLWCTVGIHPHEAAEAGPRPVERIRDLIVGRAEVVAIGETGLDYHYDRSPRSTQRALFDSHLQLAADLDLPVVVHARDADEDVAAALRNAGASVRGVLHCFTGGERAFAAARESGWWFSVAGVVSFKSFGAGDLLAEVPDDRLMVETDSPYLAPVPLRGRRNEPSFIPYVVEALARTLGRDAREVAQRTSENGRAFYRVA